MASISTSRYLIALCFLLLYSKNLNANLNESFAFKSFVNGSNFESHFALSGDAKMVDGGTSVQISGSVVPTAGRVVYRKPIKLAEGNPRKLVSFAMNFVFSLSSEKGDGLAFMLAPKGYPLHEFDGGSFGLLAGREVKFLAVEFDTSRDDKYGDVNDNHVGIDVNSLVSAKVSNVSSVNLVLNSGEKLLAWVDYEASSKRLEVRLTKLGEIRPLDPLLSYPIDLSRMWDANEMFFGLSSSSGNSSQKCNLHSWSLKLRPVPYWLHSEPLDPSTYIKKKKELKAHEKSDCAMRILAALIFGTGCGALGAFVVLFVWTVLGNKRPVVPEDFAAQPVEFKYKKPKVVDISIEDGKN